MIRHTVSNAALEYDMQRQSAMQQMREHTPAETSSMTYAPRLGRSALPCMAPDFIVDIASDEQITIKASNHHSSVTAVHRAGMPASEISLDEEMQEIRMVHVLEAYTPMSASATMKLSVGSLDVKQSAGHASSVSNSRTGTFYFPCSSSESRTQYEFSLETGKVTNPNIVVQKHSRSTETPFMRLSRDGNPHRFSKIGVEWLDKTGKRVSQTRQTTHTRSLRLSAHPNLQIMQHREAPGTLSHMPQLPSSLLPYVIGPHIGGSVLVLSAEAAAGATDANRALGTFTYVDSSGGGATVQITVTEGGVATALLTSAGTMYTTSSLITVPAASFPSKQNLVASVDYSVAVSKVTQQSRQVGVAATLALATTPTAERAVAYLGGHIVRNENVASRRNANVNVDAPLLKGYLVDHVYHGITADSPFVAFGAPQVGTGLVFDVIVKSGIISLRITSSGSGYKPENGAVVHDGDGSLSIVIKNGLFLKKVSGEISERYDRIGHSDSLVEDEFKVRVVSDRSCMQVKCAMTYADLNSATWVATAVASAVGATDTQPCVRTLRCSANGRAVFDGVSLSKHDRVLVPCFNAAGKERLYREVSDAEGNLVQAISAVPSQYNNIYTVISEGSAGSPAVLQCSEHFYVPAGTLSISVLQDGNIHKTSEIVVLSSIYSLSGLTAYLRPLLDPLVTVTTASNRIVFYVSYGDEKRSLKVVASTQELATAIGIKPTIGINSAVARLTGVSSNNKSIIHDGGVSLKSFVALSESSYNMSAGANYQRRICVSKGNIYGGSVQVSTLSAAAVSEVSDTGNSTPITFRQFSGSARIDSGGVTSIVEPEYYTNGGVAAPVRSQAACFSSGENVSLYHDVASALAMRSPFAGPFFVGDPGHTSASALDMASLYPNGEMRGLLLASLSPYSAATQKYKYIGSTTSASICPLSDGVHLIGQSDINQVRRMYHSYTNTTSGQESLIQREIFTEGELPETKTQIGEGEYVRVYSSADQNTAHSSAAISTATDAFRHKEIATTIVSAVTALVTAVITDKSEQVNVFPWSIKLGLYR